VKRSPTLPVLAALSALAVLATQPLARAYPGDVFQTAGPVATPERPSAASASQAEGATVSEAGAAGFSIPLPVAPNRQDMVPELSLTYSSTNPVRGGLAMGWSLDVPNVSVDTAGGVAQGVEFRSSLSRGRLVQVGPAENPPVGLAGYVEYRAREDADGTRYVRVIASGGHTDSWRAYTTDGRVYYFGETDEAKDRPHAATGPGVWDGRYFVTRIVDRFGNRIDFHYEKVERYLLQFTEKVPVDIALTRVDYGANENAKLDHHARLLFDYAVLGDVCPGEFGYVPVGAKLDYRTGYPLYLGARRLESVRLEVAQDGALVERRRLDLEYDMDELTCAGDPVHAPLRILEAVTDTAWAPDGVATTMPPTRFEYGPLERRLTETFYATPYGSLGWGRAINSEVSPGGWPGLESMRVDLDGDGTSDVIENVPGGHPSSCTAAWWRGNAGGVVDAGGVGFDLTAYGPRVLPIVPWASGDDSSFGERNDSSDASLREACSLAGQFSHARDAKYDNGECGTSDVYQSYRLMDVTGDGRPDLVTGIDSNRQYDPEEDPRLGATAGGCDLPAGPCIDPHTGEAQTCEVIAPTPDGVPWFETNGGGSQPPDGCSILDGYTCGAGGCACCPAGTDVSCQGGTCSCCETGSFGTCHDGCEPHLEMREPGCNGLHQPCGCVDAQVSGHEQAVPKGWEGWPGPHNPPLPGSDFDSYVGGEGDPTGVLGNPQCLHWPEMACGRYVLRVHENLGDGRFGPPQVVLAPVPLETDRPTSRLGTGPLAASSSWHGFIDLDGDGRTDAVHMPAFFFGSEAFDTNDDGDTVEPGEGAPDHFQVFFTSGADVFGSGSGPYSWRAPRIDPDKEARRARVHVMHQEAFPAGTQGPYRRETRESVTMFDVNGDGLPDYIDGRHNDHPRGPRVHYNTGRGFESNEDAGFVPPRIEFSEIGETRLDAVAATQNLTLELSAAGQMRYGFSRARIRQVDVDADGLVDLVQLPEIHQGSDSNPFTLVEGEVAVYLNLGDRFRRVVPSPDHWIVQHWPALARITLSEHETWTVVTDFVDLDGDGLPEAITNLDGAKDCDPSKLENNWNGCATHYDAYRDPEDGRAMRAMTRVIGGEGANVRFSYAPARASTGRAPHPVWVVTEMTIEPGADAHGSPAPEMTTRYAYDGPVYNEDREGRWGFRGFAVSETTDPSGASTVTWRDHSLDYAGLVSERRVYDRPEDPSHAASIETFEYELRSTLNNLGYEGTISAHLVDQRTRTCGADQDETECEAHGDLLRTLTTWTTIGSIDDPWNPLVHLAATVERRPDEDPVEGSTGETFVHELVSDSGRFWLLPRGHLGWRRGPGGVAVLESEEYTYYSTTQQAPWWTSSRTEAGGDFAVMSRNFDLTTGNLIGYKNPRWFQSTGPWAGIVYDETQTFAATTIGELGHRVELTTDPATGVVIESRGPNEKSCGKCSEPAKEGWFKTIDGFGRTLEDYVYLDHPDLGYRAEQVARFEYDDTPGPRTRVVEERIVGTPQDPWTRRELEADGLGRTVLERTFENGLERTIARSFFDAAGHLVRAQTPRPAGDDPEVVDWEYAYDALGRLIAAREPARTGCSDVLTTSPPLQWCGRRWIHDGLVTTAEDVVGTAGGRVGRTRTTHDVLGRLVLVEEEVEAGDWAETAYMHDGAGRVLLTQSADGVVTENVYDMLGRRTHVLRGGKTWKLGYDDNGNLVDVLAPVPPDADPSSFVTLYEYDELDRPMSVQAAQREVVAEDLELFDDQFVVRTYDEGENGIGRLSRVEHGSGSVEYTYEARGLPATETHSFSVLGGQYQDTRTVERTWLPSGAPDSVLTADATEPASKTRFVHHYDGRGLPDRIDGAEGIGTPSPLLSASRHASGRVKRHWALDDAFAVHDAVHDYDDAGRHRAIVVRAAPPGSENLQVRASEAFTFQGSGDVGTLTTVLTDGTVPPTPHVAVYDYDKLHRLVSATGPVGYHGAFAYSPGGRITAASVGADPEAVRVHARDVSYVYGGDVGDPEADPDAPILLEHTDGSGDYMTLEYDPFGNALVRSIDGDGTHEHVYDGFDRQRLARNPDGTEDLYFYGPDGIRSLVVTRNAYEDVESIEWTVGDAKVTYDGSGAVEREEAHAGLEGVGIRIVDHGEREYLYHDPRGHLVAAFDEAGVMKAGFRYGPYAELLESIGTQPDDFEKRFNDKERDDTSGLTYYGHRYFDERSLTWTQADPLYRMAIDAAQDEPRLASLYAFSLGNPVSLVDPNGLQPTPQPATPPPPTAEQEREAAYKEQEARRKIAGFDKQWKDASAQDYLAAVVSTLLRGYKVDQKANVFDRLRTLAMGKRSAYQLAVDRQLAARVYLDLSAVLDDQQHGRRSLTSSHLPAPWGDDYARLEAIRGAVDVLRHALNDPQWSPRTDGIDAVQHSGWDRQWLAEDVLTPVFDSFFRRTPQYSMDIEWGVSPNGMGLAPVGQNRGMSGPWRQHEWIVPP
jgi:RHS repeat-associated protein